jgi:diguanylate cyclase (GGDEF)-like protein
MTLGVSILLVGQDELGCASLRMQLEAWNYPVEWVGSDTEAVARLVADTNPSIVIIGSDGTRVSDIDLIHRIRSIAGRDRAAILLILSRGPDQASREFVGMAVEAGADELLASPIDEIDLRVRLRTAQKMFRLYDELSQQTEMVRYYSSHDRLTGAWNRESMLTLLFRETDRVQRMQTPLSLLMVDVDGFGRINADYGFDSGDRVLCELVRRLSRLLRSYDFIGRFGNDSFLLALPGCNADHAYGLAQRLLRMVAQNVFPAGVADLTLTVSAGIAQSRGRSPLVVVREAEQNLALARQRGPGQIQPAQTARQQDALEPAEQAAVAAASSAGSGNRDSRQAR